jgi:hypothetical protein
MAGIPYSLATIVAAWRLNIPPYYVTDNSGAETNHTVERCRTRTGANNISLFDLSKITAITRTVTNWKILC